MKNLKTTQHIFSGFKRWGIPCALYLYACAAFASPCLEKPTIEEVIKNYSSGLQARAKWLEEVSRCTVSAPASAIDFDNIANLGLLSADAGNWASEAARDNYIRMNADLLWILAKNGYANSQHNIAALHNTRPGSAAQKAIKQDPEIFIYWTRKAAAQGEPRAIFNLATRIARGVPSMGIAQDSELAFQLLAHLTKMNTDLKGAIAELMPAVQQETRKVSESLTATRISLIEKQAINFSALAPAGLLPGSTWDRASNVRKAVVFAYVTRRDSGADAAWRTLQQCYADALLIRSYAKEHEECISFDIAMTQLNVAIYQRQAGVGPAVLPPQYEQNAFINRTAGALVNAGLSLKAAAPVLDEIGETINSISASVADEVIRGKKNP